MYQLKIGKSAILSAAELEKGYDIQAGYTEQHEHSETKTVITPLQAAISWLDGLRMDIEESKNGILEIEKHDLAQVNNCLRFLKECRTVANTKALDFKLQTPTTPV